MKVDTSDIDRRLSLLGQEGQIPYATSRALNTLANSVQRAIRAGIADRFKLSQRSWVLNRVYIAKEERATKERRWVVISINEPYKVLSGMEIGGEKTHVNGRPYFAIPNKKVFGGRPISADNPLRISNLSLHATPYGIQGDQETAMIKSKATGVPLIIQDVSLAGKGRARRGINKYFKNRILYTLVKRVTLPAKLQFVDTATAVIGAEASTTFSAAIQQAIDTAR